MWGKGDKGMLIISGAMQASNITNQNQPKQASPYRNGKNSFLQQVEVRACIPLRKHAHAIYGKF